MTKLQQEIQEMLDREQTKADRSHAETVKNDKEIMALIKKSSPPASK